MHVVENPLVQALQSNTPAQNQELKQRRLMLEGSNPSALVARCLVFAKDLGDESRPVISDSGGATRALLAPYGRYLPLAVGKSNLVAVHVHDSGRIEVYGPFICKEEAYDYFPDHSSPHDTQVVVFRVSTVFGRHLPL
jgi:hypothetical protein